MTKPPARWIRPPSPARVAMLTLCPGLGSSESLSQGRAAGP